MIRIFRILSYSTEPKNKHLIISKQQLRVRHARQKRELRSSYFLVRGSYQRISFSSNYQSILPKNAQETTTTKKAFWRCWWFWDGWRPWTRVWKICSKKSSFAGYCTLSKLPPLPLTLSLMKSFLWKKKCELTFKITKNVRVTRQIDPKMYHPFGHFCSIFGRNGSLSKKMSISFLN